jgi:hypothetical protein
LCPATLRADYVRQMRDMDAGAACAHRAGRRRSRRVIDAAKYASDVEIKA